ncbi:MAG: hypothetical protein HOV94_03275, partial [Saccharothrix sp.]|nr:hypothetical protein [Saccharothrix sp.]
DVIGVDELAGFTDVKPADLTAWLAGRRTGRGKLRRTTGTTNGRSTARRGAGSVTLPTSGQAPAPRESVAAAGTQDVPERLVEHAS